MNILRSLPKKTLLLILGLVIIVSVLLFFLLREKPKPNNNITNQHTPTSSQSVQQRVPPVFRSSFTSERKNDYEIVFNIPDNFSLPQSVELLAVTREINDQDLNNLKNRFSFVGEARLADSNYSWSMANPTKSLVVDTKSGYIQYGTDATSTTTTKTTKDLAQIIAGDFLKSNKTTSNIEGTARVIMFRGEGEAVETNNESEVSFYEFIYTQLHKQTPIYYHFATPAITSVFVDAQGNIRGLRHFNFQLQEKGNVPLPNINQLKQNVINGGYTIVKIDGDQESVPTTGTITINSISPIQFDDKTSQTLHPIILLEGTLQPSNRKVSLYHSLPVN